MTLGSSVKLLSELRVVDLRSELEKRNLECSGVKAVLVKKLEKALKDEGKDPKTYNFSLTSDEETPKKKQMKGVNEVNGDDKSDDEKQVSDDDSGEKGDEGQPRSNELSDDEKQEEEVSGNQLSDDEQQDEADDDKIDKNNICDDDESKVSDDEKQMNADEEGKVSDDEKPSITEDETKLSDDEKPMIDEENKMSDDEKPTGDQVEELSFKKEVEDEKADEEDIQVKKEEAGSHSEELKHEEEGLPDEAQVSVKQETKESEKVDSQNEGAEAAECSSGKKLRPRITAPSDDDNSTKTPVLKKDISLPRSKPKDEEFVVPEEEADIYDREKFIVKEDVLGDSEDTMDFEVEMGNMENEDSINLTIGEDDAKFMTEEAGLENEDKDASETRKADKKKGAVADQDSTSKQQTSSELDSVSKAKSLWVSGLSSATRATDLKQLFTKHGKVIAAKIVTNAKTPGARCYGFVTMASHEDAISCIKALNLTELHGRLISVEPVADKSASKKSEELKSPYRNDWDRGIRSASNKRDISTNGDRRHDMRPMGRDRDRRRLSGDRKRPNEVLSFEQIKAERKKQKVLAVEREMRELDRRKRDDIIRQRDIERRNRDEALRLQREREKLKYERERIERERAELLILERARLEREKEELKRQKLRLEEDRRLKRTLSDREDYSRSKRPSPGYGRSYSHHKSPGRHYDRISDRSISSKRDDRKEHRRSRSPRRRSREKSSSSKGYKYPAPIYFEGYKPSASEKWPQPVDSRGKANNGSSSWSSRSGGAPPQSGSERYKMEYLVVPPPPLSMVYSPAIQVPVSSTPPRPPYSPIRTSSSHKPLPV